MNIALKSGVRGRPWAAHRRTHWLLPLLASAGFCVSGWSQSLPSAAGAEMPQAPATATAPETPMSTGTGTPGIETAAPGPAASVAHAAVAADYQLAAGDLVNVTVYNMPMLDRNMQALDADGKLYLSYLQAPLAASHETTAALAQAIRAQLQAEQILIDPQVEVSVAQVEGHPVVVSGDVRTPMVIQNTGELTVAQALLLAGGPGNGAGSEVMVTHHQTDLPDLVVRMPLTAVMAGTDARANMVLHDHDVVAVVPAGEVYAVGSVKQQGAFAIPSGQEMSLLRLVALTQGFTTGAKPKKAELIHRLEDGSTQSTNVNLQAVLARTAPDEAVAAGDVLYVPGNHTLAGTIGTAKVIGVALAGAVGYWLILR